MKPSVSRIVHFVMQDQHFAAIVTKVWSDTCVNLQVFNNGSPNELEQVFPRTSVVLDATGTMDYSWHWPETVS